MNQTSSVSDSNFLVVGLDENSNQQALVGVATSLGNAADIVGQDYLSIMSGQKLSPLEYRLTPGQSTSEPNYRMNGYSWTFVPVQFNSLLNFAL